MAKMPNTLSPLPDRCDPRMITFCFAGMNLPDLTRLGLSPIAMTCNEAWKPVLEMLCSKDGYAWEWTRTDQILENETENFPDYSPEGEAVLIKVG